jgi:(p)ppGpp synthase/HD superfamily hydrolase
VSASKTFTEVAMLVAEATEGKDPELVIAALLHDAIEDQEVPKSVIAEGFGTAVAELVEEMTRSSTNKNASVYRSSMLIRNPSEQRFSNLRIRSAISEQSQRALLQTGPLSAGSNTSSGRGEYQKD